MGSKFGGIHVKNGTLGEVSALAEGHTVRAAVPGWVSVLDSGFAWGNTQPAARRLSAALPGRTVLCVEYFDDDFVEFALYRGGKKRTRHIPASYESFDRHVGRMADFTELLELGPEEEKLLRLIFQETDPETSVHLMESLLGCPIWMDPDCPEPPETALSRAYLEEYAARKRRKIKNQTRLTLTDEREAFFPNWHLTYPMEYHRDGAVTFCRVDGAGKICEFDPFGPVQAEDQRISAFRGRSRLETIHGADGETLRGIRDEAAGVIYATGPGRLLAYDAANRELLAEYAEPENERYGAFLGVLPGIGLVTLLGESTLDVRDRELKLISRHRVKGWVCTALPRDDGALSVLTYCQRESEGVGREYHVLREAHTWVYRLGR